MRSLRYLLLTVLMVLTGIVMFHSCRKEEPFHKMKVETTAVTQILDITATAQGNIIYLVEGVEQHGHCWDTAYNPTISSSRTENGIALKTGTFTSQLTGLGVHKTYHLRAYMQSSNEVVYGEDISFTTLDGKINLTTRSAEYVTAITAVTGGNIASDGGLSISSRGVCYTTSENPTLADRKTTDGAGTGSFTSSLSDLSPNTTYYTRAYATNMLGTTYGNQKSFLSKGLPVLSTAKVVTDIADNTVTCGGNIINDWGFLISSRGVCWSTSRNPTTADSKTTDGIGTGAFTNSLSGLTQEDTYYVRAFATNSVGTSYGEERTFSLFVNTHVVEVTNPATGKIWMDRNLGAKRAAISSTDTEAYGGLYQWGRGNDGHQMRTSGTVSNLSYTDTPGHVNFIILNDPYGPGDWRRPPNDNLWQGVNGINSPCPVGYRLPTEAEWAAERNSWSTDKATGAFTSPLKLPLGGFRNGADGDLISVDYTGRYWSSNVFLTSSSSSSRYLNFNSNNVQISYGVRRNGQSVRCIKQ